MTDTDNTALEALGYHDQPELPCCENCEYAEYYCGNLECSKADWASVKPTGICKEFKQWIGDDQ